MAIGETAKSEISGWPVKVYLNLKLRLLIFALFAEFDKIFYICQILDVAVVPCQQRGNDVNALNELTHHILFDSLVTGKTSFKPLHSPYKQYIDTRLWLPKFNKMQLIQLGKAD